ncbi:Hsp20/alpha crystallin family protein [archaeon]|nr:MAG: Hsp20/alpha crystallin family protein [archaeon]
MFRKAVAASLLAIPAFKKPSSLVLAAQLSKQRGGGALAPFGWDFPSRVMPTDLTRLFDNFPFAGDLSLGKLGHMLMDVKESKDKYEVHIDLPGVKKEDVHISVKNRELKISADREQVKKEEGTTFHRVERSHGHVSRTLLLPDDADEGKVEANFENGVLLLNIAKHENTQKEAEHTIEVK